MESENEKEGKEYLKITLSTKRCICGNVIGNNPHSSVLVVKDGLKMFIEVETCRHAMTLTQGQV